MSTLSLSALTLLLVAAEPQPVALPPLEGVSLKAGEAALLTDLLAQGLQQRGMKLTAARNLSAVVGVERERELLGCAQTSCMAELAAALGVRALVLGDVGRLGESYVVTVRAVNGTNGTSLATFTGRSADEARLPEVLTEAAWSITSQLRAQGWSELSAGPDPTRAQTFSRWWAVAPAAVGLGGLSLGVAMQVLAQQRFTELQHAPSLSTATQARADGRSAELLGNVAFGVGAAGVVAAVLLLVLPNETTRPSTVWVAPAPAGLAFGGQLP